MNQKKFKGFFAYSGQDMVQAEIIEHAVELYNQSEDVRMDILTWRAMRRRSSRIITNIINQIDQSEFLLADISGLNSNVLFEIGYAFGKHKKLLLFIQGNSESERLHDLSKFGLLSGLQINSVQNSEELMKLIIENGPDQQISIPEIETYGIECYSSSQKAVFLKGVTHHEVACAALLEYRKYYSEIIVDDWHEDRSRQLSWYIQAVVEAGSMIALFVKSDWDDAEEVNARFAFVCGMAVGLGKKVQMLGLPGYQPPFDYRDILKKTDTGHAAQKIVQEMFVEDWLTDSTKILLVSEQKHG